MFLKLRYFAGIPLELLVLYKKSKNSKDWAISRKPTSKYLLGSSESTREDLAQLREFEIKYIPINPESDC